MDTEMLAALGNLAFAETVNRREELAEALVSRMARLVKPQDGARRALPDVFTWFDAVFDLPRAPFHTEILDAIVNGNDRYLLILAPPGHRKTTCAAAAVAYLLGTHRFRNCVIASYEASYASKILMQICDILMSEQSVRLLGRVIPENPEHDPRIKKWTSDERFFLTATHTSKDPTLKAIGQKSGGIGTRAQLVLCDDLVTIANSATDTLRANLWDWFAGALLKRIEPDARVIVIGARFFDGDLYGKLEEMSIERGGNWRVLKYTASPEKPLWPERFGPRELLEAYQNDPVLFPAQYLQQPLPHSRAILKGEWLQFYLPETVELSAWPHFMGVDPCKSAEPDKDKFVAIVGAFDGDTLYVVDAEAGNYPLSEQARIVIDLAKKYNVQLVNCEDDRALSSLLQESGVVRVRSSPSLLAKEVRFRTLGSHAVRGKFKLPGKLGVDGITVAENFRELVEQWQTFPATKHDDYLDALEKLVEATTVGVEPAALVPQGQSRRSTDLLFHEEVLI